MSSLGVNESFLRVICKKKKLYEVQENNIFYKIKAVRR